MMTRLRDDHAGMEAALGLCREAVAAGQAPFGAVIVDEQRRLVASAQNSVHRDQDPTAHAEVNVVRAACRVRGSTNLAGCTLYTTCEPCPMCLAAIHWAGIDRVVHGATIGDAVAAGFHQIPLGAGELAGMAGGRPVVEPGPGRDACATLLRSWKRP
jgi:guanine deaminase